MSKIELINCIGKVQINNRMYSLENREATFKALLKALDITDTFAKEINPDCSPILVKVKNHDNLSIKDMLNNYRIKQINKLSKNKV